MRQSLGYPRGRLFLPITPRAGGNYIQVGSTRNFKTIEAAVDYITGLAPTSASPVYIALDAGTYNLSVDQVVMPENSGIIGQGTDPSATVINGLADRSGGVLDNQMFLVNNGNIFENITVNANSGTGQAGQFASPAGLTGDVSFLSMVTDNDGVDNYYLFGGGTYYFHGVTMDVAFDGIAVFGSETVVVNVDTCNFKSTTGVSSPVNLLKATNPNSTVNITRSTFDLSPAATIGEKMTCINSQLSTGDWNLDIDNCVFRIIGAGAADADHGFEEMAGLRIDDCNLDMDDCQFIMVNDLDTVPGSLQDYALNFVSVADLTTGIATTLIHSDNLTLAQTQGDVSGNTVSGFKIT